MKEINRNCIYHDKHEICLSSIDLFKSLPCEAQQSFLDDAINIERKKGSVIAYEGAPIDAVIIIREGKVKTCHYDANGEEHILDVLHDGQSIWQDMFLQEHIYHYNVVAITDVSLCYISRVNFLKVVSEHPKTALNMIEMLSTQLQEANEKALLLRIKDPEERLAEFLLYRDLRCIGKQIQLKLDDIAASIGLRPETVSRNLVKLEKAGYVERLGQGKIVVKDRNGLKNITKKDSSE